VNDIVGIPDSVASSALKATTGGGSNSNPAPGLECEGAEDHRRQALLKSAEAFDRELVGMLADHADEWVAFAGSTRLGFAQSRTALIRACMSQGLRPGEFLVRRVEPQPEDVVETPRLVI